MAQKTQLQQFYIPEEQSIYLPWIVGDSYLECIRKCLGIPVCP